MLYRMRTYTVCFFNDTATTEIYTLSLHDALPIWQRVLGGLGLGRPRALLLAGGETQVGANDVVHVVYSSRADRKSTRLNSSHANISYAVFCLKKKTNTMTSALLYHHTHHSSYCLH